ncbi:MAG: hypothetical protein EOO04_40005 [Chitinophagaceae bacterium]|nr:MAG: hypothetical protein EOO04_40005 [Chitinophagaceae bacterium]
MIDDASELRSFLEKEIAKINQRLANDIVFVSFSLDKNKKAWQLMTKQDGITWYNISDLQGETSKIKGLYNIQSIPFSYLIDREGIIIETYDGYKPGMFDGIESRIKAK